MNIRDILALGKVVPVIVINKEQDALPMAEALLAGGVKTMEITLRTEAGLKAINKLSQSLPEMIVGAGTVITSDDYKRAVDAGSQFIVSPGFNEALATTAAQNKVPFLPGIATGSDIVRAMQCGLDTLKFFPAEANGGTPVLSAFKGPFPNIKFCPTGGVNPQNAKDYLQLENVLCVGGSWLTPNNAVSNGDWSAIQDLAVATATLV
jgi:2-dehydro-3-deoxyphosphogluconate aldolase/(4S)-4-hydroxy-2-oxoglutarate aldolase